MNTSIVPRAFDSGVDLWVPDARLMDRISQVLDELSRGDLPARIHRRDHTVWSQSATEIQDRLGWLDLPSTMPSRLGEIRGFVDALRARHVQDVVLLGMGGSSLAPEVFRRSFAGSPGHPRLHVLDTTSPDWIRSVTRAIQPKTSHFLVASKSGSTIEVRTLYAFFREFVKAGGVAEPGASFTAITDPGTGLEELARKDGFDRIFTNPPDLGGRYSALSFFGLVPAAILGIDVRELLVRAARMASSTLPGSPASANSGLVLGAALGVLALEGRDKLTIRASRPLDSFGLWVEQLIAESTGKEGKGIFPIEGEPILDPKIYGSDRVFALVSVGNDSSFEREASALAERGHPVLMTRLADPLDLGAEMLRWEYATAVAGHLLGIHPFDQPNVETAKIRARAVLEALSRGEKGESIREDDPVPQLQRAKPPEVVGLMVYGEPTAELEAAFASLRRTLGERSGVATTLGYGPRFLHSTGQLHKGGTSRAVYIQLLAAESPLAIPGEKIGFDQLIEAQATGDYLALRDAGKSVTRAKLEGSAANTVRAWESRIRGAGK